MLDLIGTLVSSILAGGATGLLGVIAQRWADYKNKQLDLALEKQRGELELAKRDKDAVIMEKEWAGRTRVADVESNAKMDTAESQAFAASFQHDKATYSVGALDKLRGWWGQLLRFLLGLVDVIRGVVRPGLTIYLCVITTLMYADAHRLVGGGLTATEALDLVKMIVATVLYLTTTCVLWWFGTRNRQAAPKT